MKTMRRSALYVRNVIFGVEDSLVSTVGLLAGVATVGVSSRIIIATGLILIFVEAISMAVGSFLSEESAQEYENGRAADGVKSMLGALAMFVSYVIAGLIPLTPYLIWTGTNALVWSIVLSLIVLGALGFIHARIAHLAPWVRAFRMIVLGGFAIAVGVLVGRLFGVS